MMVPCASVPRQRLGLANQVVLGTSLIRWACSDTFTSRLMHCLIAHLQLLAMHAGKYLHPSDKVCPSCFCEARKLQG